MNEAEFQPVKKTVNFVNIIIGLQIFLKYNSDKIDALHGAIYAGKDLLKFSISVEDETYLKSLGWIKDWAAESWKIHV